MVLYFVKASLISPIKYRILIFEIRNSLGTQTGVCDRLTFLFVTVSARHVTDWVFWRKKLILTVTHYSRLTSASIYELHHSCWPLFLILKDNEAFKNEMSTSAASRQLGIQRSTLIKREIGFQ